MEYAEYREDYGGWVVWFVEDGVSKRAPIKPQSTEQDAWEAYWKLDGKQGSLYKGYVFH